MSICHRQTSRRLLLLIGIALAVLASNAGRVAAADGEPTLRQRFVPADRPDLWPSEAGRDWVPVQRAELDSLLKQLRGQSRNQQSIPFSTATYHAEFDPQRLTLGQGTASLQVSSDRLPGSLVPCDPLNLSIDRPRWQDSGEPAVLGASAGGDHFLAIRPTSRVLQFDWQLAGTRRLSGVEFTVRVPSAVASALSLVTPRDWKLKASSGTVTHVRDSDDATTWHVNLGRRTETQLRFIEPGRSIARLESSLTTASLNSRFELAPLFVRSATEVSFESLAASVDSPEVQIAEAWQIRSIERVSGGAVLWQDLGLMDGLRRLRIEIPDGAVASDRGFVINSSLPFHLEKQLQLAAPRFVNAVLFDGRLQVALGPPFTLQDYSTTGLSQTDVSAESGDDGRTLLTFQQFAPDARISLSLRDDASSRARLLSIREFVVGRFDLDPPEFHADLQIAARSREVFSLETWIPDGWEVTRVTHRAAGGLLVELPWQTIEARTDGPDLVQISLPDGLETGRPALLQVSAQHVTWTRGSAPALPAVFPDVGALTSVTTGLLFRSADDANSVRLDGFEQIDQDAGLARSEWSPIASDLAGQHVSLHTLDYWEDAESRASQTVQRQASNSTNGSPGTGTKRDSASPVIDPASPAAKGPSENGPPTDLSSDGNALEPGNPESDSAEHPDATRPIVTSRLESFVSPGRGGRDLHNMSWKFAYPVPAQTLVLKLPQGAVLLETLWNDQPLAASADGENWTVPVPKVASGDTLAVRYTLRSKDIYLRDTRRVALPAFDAISASFEWVLRLRKGYSVVSLSEEMTRLDEGRRAGSLRWFFGPLARGRSADWFNPLSSEAWQKVLQTNRPEISDADMSGSVAADDDSNAAESSSLEHDWVTVRSVSGVVPQTLSIHICRLDRLHALAWFVLITACLVGVTLRTLRLGSRNRIGLLWLSGCLVAAVVVPDSYAELIGAAILGTVISTLLPRSLIRLQPKVEETSYLSMSSTIALPRGKISELVRILLVAGALLGATGAAAQNGEPALPAEIDILVPYTGDRPSRTARLPDVVYVDAAVLRQLQLAAESTAKVPTVLLNRTEWEAIIDRDGRSSVQGRLTVAIARSAEAVVHVALPASLVDPETPVLLDGQSVTALPGFGGKSLLIPNPAYRQPADRLSQNAESTASVEPEVSADPEATVAPESSVENPRPTAPSLPEPALLPETATASEAATVPEAEPPSSATDWKLHTLELRLRPETRTDGELRQFALPVSPVAQSRFQLKFEVPPAAVRDSRTGAPVSVVEDGMVVLQPGLEDVIALDWSASATPTIVPEVSVDIHSTAEIYPGRVLRQTLANVVPQNDSRVGRLAWRLPRQIQLDRQQIRAARLVDVVTEAASDHTLVILEFDPPQTEPFSVQMNWQRISADASIASDIQWEEPVSVADAPLRAGISSRLAGLKAAPGFRLASDLLTSLEQSRVSTETFLEPWPEKARPRSPQIAVRLPERGRLPIAARILPIQSQRAVRQNLEARVAPSGIRWTVSAEIETSNAPAFLHELTIPETVRIDSVSLQQDEVDRLSHWERRADRVVLFLRDRSTGIQTVTIEGRQDFDRQQPVPVPAVTVMDSQILASTLQVYSQAGLRPVVSGAAPVDSSSAAGESVNVSPSGFAGEYRLTRNSDVFLELQAVNDEHPLRWLGILDLLDDGRLTMELAIAVSTQETGEWQIELPPWAADETELLPVDGAAGDSPSAAVMAAIEGRNLTLSVPAAGQDVGRVRVRLPIDPALQTRVESGQPVTLTPPVCERQQDVPAAIVARKGSTRLGLTGQLISDQQREHVADLVTASIDESEILNWNTSSEVSVAPESTSILPSIVLHTVRCGGRMTQMCRTLVLLNSDVDTVRVHWPEGVQQIYRRIDGRLLQAGAEGVPADDLELSGAEAVESVGLEDSGSVHQLEFLWKPAAVSGQLRIRRATLAFPQILMDDSIEPFVEVVPAADVNVLPDGAADQATIDRKLLRRRLSPWKEYSESSTGPLPVHIRQTLAAMDRTAGSDMFLADESVGTQPDQVLDRTGMTASKASPLNQRLSVGDRTTLLLRPSAGGQVGVWLVDRHVDVALLVVLVGLAVILPILKFFSLQSGERLAERPMLSFVLIGLVWWLCLQGSFAGFAVLVLAAVVWTGQAAIRRLPRPASPRPAER